MRILFVTDFYHPYLGGVEMHVRTLAHALAARGHDVAVATCPVVDGPERDRDGPVAIYPVPHLAQRVGARFANRGRPWAPPVPDPLAGRHLRAVLEDFRPDVIHGHDWLARSVQPRSVSGDVPLLTTLHYYTRSCARKTLWRDEEVCDGPALARCLSCAADHYGLPRGTMVALGLRASQRLEDRRTARWISVSRATEAGNGLTGRADSVVVANPLPTVPESGGPEAGSLPLPPEVGDGPFILFVGDIRPEKGVAVLARAVAQLRNRGDLTPLVVVGERMHGGIPLPSATYELGAHPNDVVRRLWARATVGVVPSLWPEPFGLVAIEALSVGCPLVASDIAGLAEILADGGGRLVPPGDVEALANAVEALLADPAERERLAGEARDVAGRYAVEAVVDRIEEEYRAAIGVGGPR